MILAVAVCVAPLLPLPVKVTLYVPTGAPAGIAREQVANTEEVEVMLTVWGDLTQLVPGGFPLADSETVPLNPYFGAIVSF